MNIKHILYIAVLFLLYESSAYSAAASANKISAAATNKISIAIPDFKNISKNPGYDFLEKTIAESLTTSLQKSGKFNIVERQRLLDIMEEKKLSLSGLVEEDLNDSKTIGLLTKADNLILGSFSALNNKIEVNARLVRIDTGEVIMAEKIVEDVGDKLFARINDLADAIILRLAGEKAGFLNLDTTPQGAEVKIGDKSLGTTPISEKKMRTGKYSATIVKENYEIRSADFDINENQNTSLNIILEKKAEKIFMNRIDASSRMIELLSPDYQLDWALGYERFFGNFAFGLEYGAIIFFHNYQDKTAPGKVFEQNMVLYYHRADVLLKYYLFPASTFVSPYAGAGLGFTIISNPDYQLNQTAFYWKGIIGFNFFPVNRFSIFIEAIYHNMGNVTLNEKQFNLFGDYTLAPKQMSLQNILIGCGIRIGF